MKIEEKIYQEWKEECIKSIESFSLYLRVSKLDLVEFAYRNYPDDYKQDGDFDRLYIELMEYFHE